MNQSYFRPKREGPGLMRVMMVLIFFGAIGGAGFYGYQFWTEQKTAQEVADANAIVRAAEQTFEEGDLDAAASEIAAIDSQTLSGTTGGRYAILEARISHAQEEHADALTWIEKAQAFAPELLSAPSLRVFYAQCLEASGNTDDAAKIYEEVIASSPADVRAPAQVGMGRIAEAQQELVEARSFYERGIADAQWDSTDWDEALDRLGEVNTQLIFSTGETPDSTYYTVESGDNLTEIGKKLNTTQGLLIRANALADAGSLRVGDRLKYTHKDFRIVIERETRRLFLYDANGIFKRYHVGLGRVGKETTLGSYRIGNKQKDPDWFKPGHGRIPFGDPENELGTRWMPLVPEQEDLPRDLGIHGTWDDDSVGEFASSGCARLTNPQVEELYDLVVRATPVEIVDRIEAEAIDGN